MSTTLIVCDTCRRAANKDLNTAPSCGEALLAEIRPIAAAARVELCTISCLMGCEHACNVAISAPGKFTYVLGRFDPTADAAKAIVAYASGHEASETGTVPFRQWPQGVKGHFIARIPPCEGLGSWLRGNA